jgi:hypothetical protein
MYTSNNFKRHNTKTVSKFTVSKRKPKTMLMSSFYNSYMAKNIENKLTETCLVRRKKHMCQVKGVKTTSRNNVDM